MLTSLKMFDFQNSMKDRMTSLDISVTVKCHKDNNKQIKMNFRVMCEK